MFCNFNASRSNYVYSYLYSRQSIWGVILQDRTTHVKCLRYWINFLLYDVWWIKCYFGILDNLCIGQKSVWWSSRGQWYQFLSCPLTPSLSSFRHTPWHNYFVAYIYTLGHNYFLCDFDMTPFKINTLKRNYCQKKNLKYLKVNHWIINNIKYGRDC
jgi:hypothetical protein